MDPQYAVRFTVRYEFDKTIRFTHTARPSSTSKGVGTDTIRNPAFFDLFFGNAGKEVGV